MAYKHPVELDICLNCTLTRGANIGGNGGKWKNWHIWVGGCVSIERDELDPSGHPWPCDLCLSRESGPRFEATARWATGNR